MKTLLRILLLAISILSVSVHAADKPRVRIETSMGSFVLELEPAAAPKTVENFLGYVDAGFYDGTIFHRVIRDFVVQGGGVDANMQAKAGRAPIANEADNGLKNSPGSIAMARTGDPHSATSQFFVNLQANSRLDHPSFDGWGYAVFGRVVEGFEVVKRIGDVKTGVKAGQGDVPETPVLLKSARRIKAGTK